jgi:hypothetical protein
MAHVYDPKEYDFAKRKDGKVYEIPYESLEGWEPYNVAAAVTTAAHNVREAYPILTVTSTRLYVPLLVAVTVEGPRLSEKDARSAAEVFATSRVPSAYDVRTYSAGLKVETGLTLRDVQVTVTIPARPPTAAESIHPEGWDA